jgi:hypothetical protein
VSLTAVKGWIIPLSLGAVFVLLFAAANPLIANWFTQWSIGDSLKFDTLRLMFWIATVIAVWAFVCVNRRFALFDFGLNAIPASGDELVRFAPPDLENASTRQP